MDAFWRSTRQIKAKITDEFGGGSDSGSAGSVPGEPRGGISNRGYQEGELQEQGVDDPVQAEIRTSVTAFDSILRTVKLGQDFVPKNEEYVHIRVIDGSVVMKTATPDETVNNTLELRYDRFQGVEPKVSPPVGISVRLDDIRNQLDMLDSSPVWVEFRGESDTDLSNYLVVTNKEKFGWFAGPDNRDTHEAAPEWLPEFGEE